VVFPPTPTCRALLDDDWLPLLGPPRNWVLLMRDTNIRYRPGEKEKIVRHGIRAFCFTHAGNYSKWRTLHLIVTRWDGIEQRARDEPGPYIYSVTYEGFKRLI